MKLLSVFILAALLSTWCLLDTRLEKKDKLISSPQNLAPKVTMNLSGINRSIKPGQQVIYSVEVSDAEDGSTKYQEISHTEVFVEIRYSPDQSQTNTFNTGPQADTPGLVYLKEAACFNCHLWKTQLVGPAFVDIISKYHSNHSEQLVSSILQGSIGKWGDEMMPSQLLSEYQAEEIVGWLMNGDKHHLYDIQPGTEGFFTTDVNLKQGYYIVTASYRDRGIGESKANRLTGYHRMVLTIES